MSRERLIATAKSGDARAQRELGKIYFEVEEDYQSSFYWYMEAAKKGDAFSQYEVGYMYEKGYGVKSNCCEAAKWYTISAENGDEAGQEALSKSNLQLCFSKYKIIRESLPLAEKGDIDAQRNLGDTYNKNGNYKESFRWYMEAAKKGDAFSQYEVGYMYENGRGVEKSDYEAVKWYKPSAENGDKAAQDALKKGSLQSALRQYEEDQRRKEAKKPASSAAISKPLQHYNYPYNAGLGLRMVSAIGTTRLFDIVTKAPRTGLSDELIETPYDRITDRRIPKRVSGFSTSLGRKEMLQSLGKFASTDTSEFKGGHLSKQNILKAKGLGEFDAPDIPYDASKPIILVQSTSEEKSAWFYVQCDDRQKAESLKRIIARESTPSLVFKYYGKVVKSGWGTEPPSKYNDWYKWDEVYFQTLLDCETCLAHGATFEKEGRHIIEEAAKRNNTELFYYLLMQAWDKAGYYGMVDLGKTKHINPKSLPAPLKQALSMSLFWAVQYGNPVMADIALHYGADPNYPSQFSGVTPMELAVYYGNDMILDVIEERDISVKHRLAEMRRGTPQTPTIDRYYQQKAAYVTENIEPDESRKRGTFLKLFHRLKRNNYLHLDIRKQLFEETKDVSFILDRGVDNENVIVGTKHDPVESFKASLERGERVTITVPKELMRRANLTSEQYSQLLKEITTGALLGQTAGVNLPSSDNEYNSLQVMLPSAFRDTLAGQIVMDADYLMKTICHIPSTYFPLNLQSGALEKLKQEGLFASSSLASENPKLALQIYRRSGARVLTDDFVLNELAFKTEERVIRDRETISRRVDPAWVTKKHDARFMFDGEGGVLVYNPITKQVSVDLQSIARNYQDYTDTAGKKRPQTITPLKDSCMWDFNRIVPNHPYTAEKIARLDLVYQLTAIVLAFTEQGRIPSFASFPALQSPRLYETPFLLPPLLHLHQQGIHGSIFAHLFGGVGELGNLGSSENRGAYQPKSKRYTGSGSYSAGQGVFAYVGVSTIVTLPGERIGYHATMPEFAESILREGFRQGTKLGRLGAGTYVSSTSEGALAEFEHSYRLPRTEAEVLRAVYTLGVEARTDRAPSVNYGYESKINNREGQKVRPDLDEPLSGRQSLPISGIDSVSAPSVRHPSSKNTNVLDRNNIRAVDKLGLYRGK